MPGWESGLPGAPTFSFLEGKGEVYHTDYTNNCVDVPIIPRSIDAAGCSPVVNQPPRMAAGLD